MLKGFILGLVTALVLVAIAVPKYGAWRQKLGTLQGRKDGSIEVIDFLAEHFPAPSDEVVPSDQSFGFKWYRVLVIETNGVKTLRIKNEM